LPSRSKLGGFLKALFIARPKRKYLIFYLINYTIDTLIGGINYGTTIHFEM
jgi:hypothetical protein